MNSPPVTGNHRPSCHWWQLCYHQWHSHCFCLVSLLNAFLYLSGYHLLTGLLSSNSPNVHHQRQKLSSPATNSPLPVTRIISDLSRSSLCNLSANLALQFIYGVNFRAAFGSKSVTNLAVLPFRR